MLFSLENSLKKKAQFMIDGKLVDSPSVHKLDSLSYSQMLGSPENSQHIGIQSEGNNEITTLVSDYLKQ